MVSCCIVGATGLVGSMFIKILEEKNITFDKIVFCASNKSKGKKIIFANKEYEVCELTHEVPKQAFTYCLFSAGAKISREYVYEFVNYGTVVIDNSSAYRMATGVPLVVPEVNMQDAYGAKVIANPNCSTIQAVVALKPLHDKYKIKRVIISTYQSVSGGGHKGIEDLENTSKGEPAKKFAHKIYNNCIPQIDEFIDNGYTKEEMKMINETKKILHDDKIEITATCVRVPVYNSHSESINVEFENEIDVEDIRQLLNVSDGIVVQDDIKFNIYPLCGFATGTDYVYVGRIRRDYSSSNGINMWIVADNIRKGAATNAVQILENMMKRE